MQKATGKASLKGKGLLQSRDGDGEKNIRDCKQFKGLLESLTVIEKSKLPMDKVFRMMDYIDHSDISSNNDSGDEYQPPTDCDLTAVSQSDCENGGLNDRAGPSDNFCSRGCVPARSDDDGAFIVPNDSANSRSCASVRVRTSARARTRSVFVRARARGGGGKDGAPFFLLFQKTVIETVMEMMMAKVVQCWRMWRDGVMTPTRPNNSSFLGTPGIMYRFQQLPWVSYNFSYKGSSLYI